MPRYVVERTFPQPLQIPIDAEDAQACLAVVDANGESQVSWPHSHVSQDKTKTFCVYDGPSLEGIRAAAARNGLPVDIITEVSVLDRYFYR